MGSQSSNEKSPFRSKLELARRGGMTDEAAPDNPGNIPVCPRCKKLLLAKKHETGIEWTCGSCGGQSLNYSQFRRMIPELQANEIWMTAMEQPGAPRNRTRCPECRRDMAAVLIPSHGREVELDVCRGCQRLWLDNQEVMSGRLSLDETEPGKKPPVIRMTGRGVARMVREQTRRISDRVKSENLGPSWHYLVIVFILFLLRLLLKRH